MKVTNAQSYNITMKIQCEQCSNPILCNRDDAVL